MPVTSDDFRRALGSFPSGVVVATSLCADNSPAGVTISAFSSVSLDPPLVLVCLDVSSNHLDDLCSGAICINILADDQAEVSNRFAAVMDDRFTGIEWGPASNGAPKLTGAAASLECQVDQVLDGGDHKIILLAVDRVDVDDTKTPLIYLKGGYGQFGNGDS